ncbi:MAG: hypothetical protein JXB49_17970 [Bacteroidales bacterium]|nr:hypothetical protein [Bacteroidales bacterium]
MNSIRTICTILTIFFLFSCEDPDDFDCDQCLPEKPSVGDLKIKLTINGENPEVPITIYFDNIDGFVFHKATVRTDEYLVEGALNQDYAVEARYIVDGDTIFVIDADYMEYKEATCDEQCWIIKGDVFDVRLKYNK